MTNPNFHEIFAGIWPPRDAAALAALTAAFRTEEWSRVGGTSWRSSSTGRFEERFAALTGARHCLAINNATVALELALLALGVKPGDEVIVPALSFVASATAISACGAVPCFADVDPATLNIDLADAARLIGPRTVGVVAVHLAGVPCAMAPLLDLCASRKLFLVEDCSHAHGSRWANRSVGTFGQFGVFSLQQGKLLTCGEGAAVTTNDDALLRRLFSHHTFHTTMASGIVDGFDAVVSRNSRLPNLLGALLLPQLERFEELSRCRQRHMAIFREELAGLPGLRPLLPPPEASDVTGYYVTYHYDPSAMGGRSAADFGAQLNARGIPAFRGHNQPMYWREPYVSGAAAYRRSACKVAEELGPTRYLNFKHEMFLADERTIRQVAASVREIAEGS